MPANCLAPIIKCAYKKAQQQIKEEAFQDGDFLQKVHQYLSSPDVLENTLSKISGLHLLNEPNVHGLWIVFENNTISELVAKFEHFARATDACVVGKGHYIYIYMYII